MDPVPPSKEESEERGSRKSQKIRKPHALKNVTRENYAKLARNFLPMQDVPDDLRSGFVIARIASLKENVLFPATPDQWNAWIKYFQGKGINTSWMQQRRYYTVPTEWPHQFDADA